MKLHIQLVLPVKSLTEMRPLKNLIRVDLIFQRHRLGASSQCYGVYEFLVSTFPVGGWLRGSVVRLLVAGS
jgi:hypothetical protein